MVAGPAFLFDLDGTLVDSVYQHVLAWQDALDQTGIELAVWRIHRKIGMSGGLFANALLRETGRAVTPEEADRLQGTSRRGVREPGRPCATTARGPRAARAPHRLDVPWAIATSGYIESAGPTMEGLGIPETTPVITRDQVAHAKPDPDLFLAAAAALDVDITHAVVVGDSVWDLLAARARERWASGCCPADTARRSSSALAHHEAHHLEDRLVAGRRRQRRAAVTIVGEHLHREVDDCRALSVSHAGLDLVQHRRAWADASLKQGAIAAHVDERHHQRRRAGGCDGAPDERVVLRDRLLGRTYRDAGHAALLTSKAQCRQHMPDRCGRRR